MRRNRGFTLLEVLVSATIFSVVLAFTFDAMNRALKHSSQGVVISTLRVRSQQALDRMSRDFQQTSVDRIYTNFATKVKVVQNVPVSGVELQVCQRGASAADVTAAKSLDPASTLAVGDPIYEPQARGYRLDAARRKLVFQVPGGGNVDILDQVSGFRVTRLTNGRVQVTLTLSASDPDFKGKTVSFTDTTLVVPMNP